VLNIILQDNRATNRGSKGSIIHLLRGLRVEIILGEVLRVTMLRLLLE
jgi:hypothetical protein